MPEQADTPNPNPAQGAEAAPPLTINQILLAEVDAILAQQGENKSWNKEEHCGLLTRLAMRFGLPPATAAQYHACLLEQGTGGNASQFRQWLERPVDKKGAGRLKEAEAKKLSKYF